MLILSQHPTSVRLFLLPSQLNFGKKFGVAVIFLCLLHSLCCFNDTPVVYNSTPNNNLYIFVKI